MRASQGPQADAARRTSDVEEGADELGRYYESDCTQGARGNGRPDLRQHLFELESRRRVARAREAASRPLAAITGARPGYSDAPPRRAERLTRRRDATVVDVRDDRRIDATHGRLPDCDVRALEPSHGEAFSAETPRASPPGTDGGSCDIETGTAQPCACRMMMRSRHSPRRRKSGDPSWRRLAPSATRRPSVPSSRLRSPSPFATGSPCHPVTR